jgi:hypothetical protein
VLKSIFYTYVNVTSIISKDNTIKT